MAPEALGRLVEDIRTVARTSLSGSELGYGVLGGDPERLRHSVITVLYERASGKPIAFNALAWMEIELRGRRERVLHLGLVMIDPEARGGGLSWLLYGYTCFVLFLRGGMRPLWISSVTQVPAVFGMVAESFSRVYPALTGEAPRFEHVLLARRIMRDHRHVFGVGEDAAFDETRFVIANAYTGGSDSLKKRFAEAAKHRKEAYNEKCARDLDYERGDDFLQLGQVTPETAQKYLRDVVPKESLPGVAVSLCFVALQALVLPVLHWLDADAQWGSLRQARNRLGAPAP
jgi:hypothetical protein